MEGAAVAVCEILKYLIIHWKCETAGVSKGTLLERQLVISMEALNSKHQANTLHCVTTIASAGSIYDGLVLRKFLKGVYTLLTAHLSTILTESHSVVQDSIQVAVDQALEQHYQAKAADTQEFGTKLNKSFHEITWHRYLPYCSCEMKQLLPEKNAEQSTEDAHENSSPEQLAGTGGQVENKTLKRGSLRRGMKETRTFPSAKASRQSEAAACRTEPTGAGASPTSGGSRESPGGGLEDSLWLQEVSNLSEWLSPGPGP